MGKDVGFDEVYSKVKELIAEVFGADAADLSLETRFVDDLGAESLDIITLLMEFEEAFDKQIPDEEAENLATIGDAVHYIMSVAGKSSGT